MCVCVFTSHHVFVLPDIPLRRQHNNRPVDLRTGSYFWRERDRHQLVEDSAKKKTAC